MKILVFAVFIWLFLIVVVLSESTTIPDLADGYKLISDGRYNTQMVDSLNNVLVKSHILNYSFDSIHIVLLQRPWDSIRALAPKNYKESNKMFSESNLLLYWIVEKRAPRDRYYDERTGILKYSNVHGPFTEKEFILRREILQVSDSLLLTVD